jgi:hypothetical protein
MNGLRIEIELDAPEAALSPAAGEPLPRRSPVQWQPGETLTGEFRIANASGHKLRAAECSILWYTLGKGDEDLHVHALERFELASDGRSVSSCTRPFSFNLPPSPQSYDGVIVKIRWCVRVRVFLTGGQEVVSETPIVLGNTASVRLAEPISELVP